MRFFSFLFSLVIYLLASCSPSATSLSKPSRQLPFAEKSPKKMYVEGSKNGPIHTIDAAKLYSLLSEKAVILIDARPPLFYLLGHIPQAYNFPLKRYKNHSMALIEYLKKRKNAPFPIVLYCQNEDCPDGELLAKKLIQRGFSPFLYKGGWEEWQSFSFPPLP